MDKYAKYTIPPLHREILLGLLKLVTDLFEKEKITYFIEDGTLLGSVRNGELIPHDDDIDIGIFHNDFARLTCLEKLKEQKFSDGVNTYSIDVEYAPNLYKIYVPNLWVKNEFGVVTATPTIDFFEWNKGDKIKLTSISQRQKFKNCYFLKKEMFPLRKYKVNHLEVWGPKDGIPFLKRYYGSDCIEVARIDRRVDENLKEKDRESIEYRIEKK